MARRDRKGRTDDRQTPAYRAHRAGEAHARRILETHPDWDPISGRVLTDEEMARKRRAFADAAHVLAAPPLPKKEAS